MFDKITEKGTAVKALLMAVLAEALTNTNNFKAGTLSDDVRAQSMGGAGSAVNLVVGLVVGALVAAFLIPIAIDELVNVDTTSWGSGAASLWDILDVILVLAIFLFFIGMALRNRM
jgi:hypothetical protein